MTERRLVLVLVALTVVTIAAGGPALGQSVVLVSTSLHRPAARGDSSPTPPAPGLPGPVAPAARAPRNAPRPGATTSTSAPATPEQDHDSGAFATSPGTTPSPGSTTTGGPTSDPVATPSTTPTRRRSPSGSSPTRAPSPSSTPSRSLHNRGKDPARAGEDVYLTFDDGPGPATRAVLAVLARTGATATFFQLGVNVHGQHGLEGAIRAQGSNIGNHSYSHPDLTTLTPADLELQIHSGISARCFRPPYGRTNPSVRRAIETTGAREVLWTVDTRDWTRPGVQALQLFGASHLVRPGSIILMHDGGGDRQQTVDALPAIVTGLQARGYHVRALPYC